MDKLLEIEETIFGSSWRLMPTKEKDLVERVLNWCIENPSILPKEPIFKPSWSDLMLKAMDESLRELYGANLGYFMKRRRDRERVEVRNQLFSIYREKTSVTLQTMEKIFCYNHATIIHGIEMHKTLCKYDRGYKEKYDSLLKIIEKKCENSLTSSGDSGSLPESL